MRTTVQGCPILLVAVPVTRGRKELNMGYDHKPLSIPKTDQQPRRVPKVEQQQVRGAEEEHAPIRVQAPAGIGTEMYQWASYWFRRVSHRVKTVDQHKQYSWLRRWFKPTHDEPYGSGSVRALTLFLGYGGVATVLHGVLGGGSGMIMSGVIMTTCGVLWRSLDL